MGSIMATSCGTFCASAGRAMICRFFSSHPWLSPILAPPTPMTIRIGPRSGRRWPPRERLGSMPLGCWRLWTRCSTPIHGQTTFWMTGWSAGGHLTWQVIFSHPERLAGAVLAGANYAGRGITTISTAPQRVQLPIKAFQGESDPLAVALTQQWEAAAQQARAHGYTNLSREIITSAGHTPFPDQVFSYLANVSRLSFMA